MRNLLVLIALSLLIPIYSSAAASLNGVDLFGTSQITLEQVQARHGSAIQDFARAQLTGDMEGAQKLKNEIESGIRQMGDFAYVNLSLIQYFDPGQPAYLTIDVVDAKDRDARMPFLPVPTQKLPDPDSLLGLWDEYMETAWDLVRSGEISTGRVDCPAFHCIFGYDHPKLKKYGDIFTGKVPGNKERLIQALKKSENSNHRGNAAYLLAHIQDGRELVELLAPSIRDLSEFVRNNVMRVLSAISTYHKDLDLSIDAVLEALNFPSTTDRNKASAILAGLADRPAYQKDIIKKGGHILLKILRLTQPNNHDFAYQILRTVSGKDFDERDYAAWERWVEEASR